MAATAGHVTMLQRSPTYIASLPAVDPVAAALNRRLPRRVAHQINRFKSIVLTQAFYQYCQRFPNAARRFLGRVTAAQLPPGYPLDPDFTPKYNPWDQRMCLVPDGDLFKAISDGRASVVTGVVDRFTEHGVRLASGDELPADIIVTATGLQLQMGGGASLSVDGRPTSPGQTFVYRGCMLSGVPNFAMCVGYTNASWTLRADLSSKYMCRLLRHMDSGGYAVAVPTRREAGGDARPLLNLSSGYVQRAVSILPKQGARPPWMIRQNYLLDFFTAHFADVTDEMTFSSASGTAGSVQGVEPAAVG
jgi:cation diffusion facilitator CzcD-associated flavoprotein CzcO